MLNAESGELEIRDGVLAGDIEQTTHLPLQRGRYRRADVAHVYIVRRRLPRPERVKG